MTTSLVWKWQRFGAVGLVYELIDTDGDRIMRVRVVETGVEGELAPRRNSGRSTGTLMTELLLNAAQYPSKGAQEHGCTRL